MPMMNKFSSLRFIAMYSIWLLHLVVAMNEVDPELFANLLGMNMQFNFTNLIRLIWYGNKVDICMGMKYLSGMDRILKYCVMMLFFTRPRYIMISFLFSALERIFNLLLCRFSPSVSFFVTGHNFLPTDLEIIDGFLGSEWVAEMSEYKFMHAQGEVIWFLGVLVSARYV